MLLSKLLAMLTGKEVPCVENLQMAYCANYGNIRFFYCYRDTGHFLCGVEKAKRFRNVHSHCIVSNLKMISKVSTLPPWQNFCGRPCPYLFFLLGRWSTVAFLPCPCKWGTTLVEVPFHNSIIDNFMVDQDRLKTNLLQLFAHPESSGWFSIISVIICEVNIVD